MIFPASEIYRSSQKVKLDTAFHLGLFCFLEIEGQGGDFIDHRGDFSMTDDRSIEC
jgi:hypothetical protein